MKIADAQSAVRERKKKYKHSEIEALPDVGGSQYNDPLTPYPPHQWSRNVNRVRSDLATNFAKKIGDSFPQVLMWPCPFDPRKDYTPRVKPPRPPRPIVLRVKSPREAAEEAAYQAVCQAVFADWETPEQTLRSHENQDVPEEKLDDKSGK